jgi:hypothetical protein
MNIDINVTYVCDKCHTVNKTSVEQMELSEFENLTKTEPSDYWKEDKDGKVIYKRYVESNSHRCRGSC